MFILRESSVESPAQHFHSAPRRQGVSLNLNSVSAEVADQQSLGIYLCLLLSPSAGVTVMPDLLLSYPGRGLSSFCLYIKHS